MLGQVLGRYRILEKVGSGGMGVVYRAHDQSLDRDVAVKVLPPGTLTDEAARRRFRKEALALAKLNHPSIETIYEFDTQEGVDFLAMEFVPGATLREQLAQSSLPEKETLRLGVQLAQGLTAAHDQGVIHRDLKPSNLGLTPDGRLKILDFGLAKLLQPVSQTTMADTASETQGGMGTVPYMSPEQLRGKPTDVRSDIYSAGAVLYEMATGRRPFPETHMPQLIDDVLNQMPSPPGTVHGRVSSALENIILKALDKDPERRYQSARELAVDLERLHAPSQPAEAQGRAPVRRRRVRNLATAVLAVLLLGIGVTGIPRAFEWIHRRLGAPVPQEKQVAVLPFEVLGGDLSTKAFGDGLTETLTAKLTQLTARHALQVVPASEVRDRKIASTERARQELGANLVLTGSLQQSRGMARVTCELVDTRTRRQLRANTLTVAASDPFAVEDQVVDGALQMLELELQPAERRNLGVHGTQVAGAYEFYLQGRGYLQNYDRVENLQNAIAVFERALTLDPNYALAYAGLGQSYWLRYGQSKDTRWVQRSREACERARALDPKLSPAHVCLATLASGTGQYEKAVEEFGRALEAEPTSDDAYRGLAEAYEHLGKVAEAEKVYRRAVALRPQYWAGYNGLGVFYYHQGRYADAVAMFNQVIALVPDSFRGYSNLGAALNYQGRYREAIATLQRSINVRPTASGYSNLGNAYFYLRRYDEAARAYEQAVKLKEGDYVLWRNLGDGYYWSSGKHAQAAGAYQHAISLARETLHVNAKDASALGTLAVCHAMLADKNLAMRHLRQGLRLAPGDPEMLFKAALVYNRFGEADQALTWLEKALAAGYPPAVVRDIPDFDPLRSQPGFERLLRLK